MEVKLKNIMEEMKTLKRIGVEHSWKRSLKTFRKKQAPLKEHKPSTHGQMLSRKKRKHGYNTTLSRVEAMKYAEGLKAPQGAASHR
jgi:tellurite resistance protein